MTTLFDFVKTVKCLELQRCDGDIATLVASVHVRSDPVASSAITFVPATLMAIVFSKNPVLNRLFLVVLELFGHLGKSVVVVEKNE